MNLRLSVTAILLCGASALGAQQAWTVKPEWVQAHEDFLASDVMAGRGSATRDEQITATYVASEFESYGLKMAPGMSSYIQPAEVNSVQLDGHATLSIGGVTLNEGVDFDLLTSTGASVDVPLTRVDATGLKTAHIERGATVLVTGLADPNATFAAFSQVRRAGAAVVLIAQTPGLSNLYGMMGGKTRTPIHLAEENESPRGASLVLLRADAAARLPADGTVSLTVHEIPQTAVRQTFNAIGYLPGTDPNAGTILLSAHLDHLGIGRPVNGDSIYNGANDDAAGTTAVLELAHALAAGPPLKRSVLFVCYGSEELGDLGSTYFGMHPPVPLKDLVANLEFEMIGNQDPKMPPGVLLLTGWDRSNLGPALKEHGALLGPDPYPEQHFFERSDNYALALQGVVAHTAAGWGTPPTYHQPSDDLAHLDVAFMTRAIQSLIEPVRWLASSDFRPAWNAGGQPHRGN
ncbi:MAG TPA: M28 family peptidase [Terracidiphilus sp.]|nr:M28 family peptidase [Terracidiphilus sp.]